MSIKDTLESLKIEMKRFAKCISSGDCKNLVSDELEKKRLEVCYKCEHLFKPTKNCKKCGCFIQFKTKFADQTCPINKWGTEKATINLFNFSDADCCNKKGKQK